MGRGRRQASLTGPSLELGLAPPNSRPTSHLRLPPSALTHPPPDLHKRVADAALRDGKSLNAWVATLLEKTG